MAKYSKSLIWDLPIRIFHWLMVMLVLFQLASGLYMEEWWLTQHVLGGYAILVLLFFRVLWGLWGTHYAKFSSFSYGFFEVITYLSEVIKRKPKHYIGHNPAGSWMIFLLIISLVIISISGLIKLWGVEKLGYMAPYFSYEFASLFDPVHYYLSLFLILLIVSHVAGVTLESLLLKENLVNSMISGLKKIPKNSYDYNAEGVRRVDTGNMAYVLTFPMIFIFASILVSSGLSYFQKVKMSDHGDFAYECAECHVLYHPSLLPENSWIKLMDNLGDHFGEDASLDEDVVEDIKHYLVQYSSENWDSEAANKFRMVSKNNPYQLTNTPFWRKKHENIDKSVFERESIKIKSNCDACHMDAKIGVFEDAKINIPD